MKLSIALLAIGLLLGGCLQQSDGAPRPAEGSEEDESIASVPRPVPPTPDVLVKAGHGDAHLSNLEPEAVVRLIHPDGFEQSAFVDDNGSIYWGFLQPNSSYTLSYNGQSLNFTTENLPWDWAGPMATIQPGAEVDYCSLSAIVRDAAYALYGVIPGHCAVAGGRVTVGYGDEKMVIGQVVFWRQYSSIENGSHDYAFFAIQPDLYELVNPAVRELGGPTSLGYYTKLETDDELCFYGHGMRHFLAVPAYRCGTYEGPRSNHETDKFWIRAFAYDGDSGAPLLNETGAWHGIITGGAYFDSHLAQPACNIMALAREAGWDFRLVTAPLTGADPDLHPPGIGAAARALSTGQAHCLPQT